MKKISFIGQNNEQITKRLDEIASITMGQSPQSKYYNMASKGKLLVQGNADIRNRETKPRLYSEFGNKECEKRDIIMSVRAPVGSVAKSDGNYYIGRGVCAIKSQYAEYIYQYLLWHEDKWDSYSTGSTFDSIKSDTIKSLLITIFNNDSLLYQTSEMLSQIDNFRRVI